MEKTQDHNRIHRDEILRLLEGAEREGRPPEVLERLRWFRAFAESQNISRVCDEFGISRSTFYRWARRFDQSDLSSLEDEKVSFPESLREGVTANPNPRTRFLSAGWAWKLMLLSLLSHAAIGFGSGYLRASAENEGQSPASHVMTMPSGRQLLLRNCLPEPEGEGWTCSVLSKP